MNKRQSRGITLIALIITIIIMLILAGVGVSVVINSDGLFAKAKDASYANEYKIINEAISIKLLEKGFASYNTDSEEYLRNIGVLDDAGVLNLASLGLSASKGNGSWDKGDMFIITNNMLRYYDKNKTFSDVGEISGLIENIFAFTASTGTINGIMQGVTIENLVIPKTINNTPVKAISPWSIQGREDLKTITIYADIVSLDNGIFESCANLEKITFNSTLQSIGISTFQHCTNLREINLNNTIITNIGNLAFAQCPNIIAIKLPNTLKQIGSNTFDGCASVKNVTIPQYVEKNRSICICKLYRA